MAAVAKQALKAAKAALDAESFDEAISQATTVLEADPQNYFGHVFLGRASEKKGDQDAAIKAYAAATRIKPQDELAWKGLCGVHETQGSKGIELYISASLGLAQVYAEKSDRDQCQTVIDKAIGFAKAHGSRTQYKEALKLLLPASPIYDFLEGRIQPPSLTFTRIAEITEAEEKERINKEIGERRTRLGAKVSQVTTEVTREVLSRSELEALYQSIIEWSSDDEIRREYEEKLLQRAHDTMAVLLPDAKASKRIQVVKLAHDMVIIKHPFRLAWDIELEWADVENVEALDQGVITEYTLFFPDSGVSKAIHGYRGYRPNPKVDKTPEEEDIDDKETKEEESKPVALNTEDRLLMISEAMDESPSSAFAHRLITEYYLTIEEHESCVEVARKSLKLVAGESQKTAFAFEQNIDVLRTCLATSLVYYQAPKNHPEARSLFDEVLKRKPNSTPALLGIGLVYEEQENFKEAASFLEKALDRDPENIRIGAEAAWCQTLNGELQPGLTKLQDYLTRLNATKGANLELKSLTSYRVGKCLWELHTDKASRKDRKGAYAYFIAALRASPNLAPAYTSLGLYYADYSKDRKRAKQCFQKAFELSAGEVYAAERLARVFAEDGEWDIVEIISQRVIESGVAKPAPGSKRKGVSWPFAGLGVVQMNSQDYSSAVTSFQAALRIQPTDYNSWVSLGESYHSSGRYNAARRALEHAQSLPGASQDEDYAWFAEYMLANVHRELGEHDEAIERYRLGLKHRPQEFGILIALLQTQVERADHCVESGFFGQAAYGARECLTTGADIDERYHNAFNFWKAIGDACMIFTWIPNLVHHLPLSDLSRLVGSQIDESSQDEVLNQLDKSLPFDFKDSDSGTSTVEAALAGGIVAYRRGIAVSATDLHAQAVGWYNLGWAEYRAFTILDALKVFRAAKYATTALRCFKRAIELEMGNSDFWNALGVAATKLNVKVAQHAFVRSLHINERSARTWTDLGALYLSQNDHELAHQAFSRAQSTDPDYALAWLGEGIIALLFGDMREAVAHFTHAVEIADASQAVIKGQYLLSTFDQLLRTSVTQADVVDLIRPIFAARQLQTQSLHLSAFQHILALLLERVKDYETAVSYLQKACERAESLYEENESPQSLAEYIKAKTDLARNQLAIRSFEDAAENAGMALDLSDDADASGLDAEQRRKCRMSAHMTAGLAQHHLGRRDDAISMFRSALEESEAAAHVVCVLAQMLWARGGDGERQIAKEQLFECIEKHTGHVGATTLLGAMAFLQDDDDTLDAVQEDLKAFRTDDKLSLSDRARVETLLESITAGAKTEGVALSHAEVQQTIMLSPSQPNGWAQLAEATMDPEVAEMGAHIASGAVPPRGRLDAAELSEALARTGRAGDAQVSILLSPWQKHGWESFAECLGS